MSFFLRQPPEDDIEAKIDPTPRDNGEGSSTGVSSYSGWNSGHVSFRGSEHPYRTKTDELDEYGKLDHFIATHDRNRRANEEHGSKSTQGKRRWWQFWKSWNDDSGSVTESIELGKVPENWLDTDIRAGLTLAQVEERRKRYGWNELVAEKHNIFQQIIGYFKGPIIFSTFWNYGNNSGVY